MTPFYSTAYLATQVHSSDPLALVIALYETAIGQVAAAMEAIEAGDAPRRRRHVGKAAEVLMALCEALDHSVPGHLAGRLFALYNYQLLQLLHANRDNDSGPLQIVKSSLSILLDGWEAAAASTEGLETLALQAQAARENAHAPGMFARPDRPPLVLTA